MNTKKTKHFVEDRLIELKSIKDKYGLTNKAKTWRDKVNAIEEVGRIDENDFRTQVSAVVKRQKDAELSANMPEYSFIPLDDDGETNRKIVREAWKYHWLLSNTDKQIGKVIKSATTYGTGIMFEGIKHLQREINEIYYEEKDGVLEEKVRKKPIKKSFIYCEKVPFSNFFINGTDIDNATEAIVIKYIDKDDYIKEKEQNPIYKNIGKLKNTKKEYSVVGDIEGEDIGSGSYRDNVITELDYYNIATDEHIVVANGIEILRQPIPYAHKQLPFLLYYDNEAEDRIWGIGEFELLEEDELAKNEYRTLTIKAVKASIGFILKESGSDFTVEDTNFGIGEVVETDDIDGVRHFAPNTPIQAISELEAKVDNDIIAKSGVDFKTLFLAPSESATRTASKNNSVRKRINLNIKDNGYNFFRRLGELRLSNIQQLHSIKPIRTPIEGGSIRSDGVFISDETGSYGAGYIGRNLIKGEFLVMPITETMLGNNKQRRKDNLTTFMQVAGNLLTEEQKPVIKGTQLAKLACEEYGYDFEKLTEETEESQNPQSIIDNIFNEKDNNSPQDINDPNYIPPEQRRQRDQVKAISGQAKIPLEEE